MTRQINAEQALQLSELFEAKAAYYKQVIRTKTRIYNNEYEIEDIFEKACLNALNGLHTFEGRNSAQLSTWFAKIVKNTCLRHFATAETKRSRASFSLDGLTRLTQNDEDVSADALGFMESPEMTPEEACEANEFYTVIVASFIKACTSRLSAGEQKMLRATEGLDLTQMSAERKQDLAAEIGATYEVVRGYITSIPRKLALVVEEYRDRGYFADSSDALKAIDALNMSFSA